MQRNIQYYKFYVLSICICKNNFGVLSNSLDIRFRLFTFHSLKYPILRNFVKIFDSYFFLLKNINLIFNYVYTYTSLWKYIHMEVHCPRVLKEKLRYLGAGVTDNCELLKLVLEIKTISSARTVYVLKY